MKNWFSSYVYESPTLDTKDGFNDSLYKESECEEDGLIVDESSREKVDGYVEFKRTRIRDDIDSSNRLINCGNYSGDNKQEKQLPNKVLISSLCFYFSVPLFFDYLVLFFTGIKTTLLRHLI